MRSLARAVTLQPGQQWPQIEGNVPIPPFRWLHVANRATAGSGNDLVIGINSEPVVNDATVYPLLVAAGCTLTRNITGHLVEGEAEAHHVRILNIGTGAVTFWIELDREPIVHMVDPISPSATQAIALAAAIPVLTPAGGSAGISVVDASQFSTETIATLAGGATFTGGWHDCLDYNWVAALALSDQAGTLFIDEADSATPTVTNLVAKAATAATDAQAPTPPAAGQVARIVPSKTVLRWCRVRYINGATPQTRFNVQMSLSPLN